jgi:hypothetical protein
MDDIISDSDELSSTTDPHLIDDEETADQIEDLFNGPGIDFELPFKRPTSWTEIFDINSVDPKYQHYVRNLLDTYPGAYSHHNLDLGLIKDKDLELHIDVYELPPKGKIYDISPPMLEPTRTMLNELLAQGVLRPGLGPCSAPCFLLAKNVKERQLMKELKESGTFSPDKIKWRWLADHRELNKRIIPLISGINNISTILAKIQGKKYVSLLDLSQAFFQIKISEPCQFLTQISLSGGLSSFYYQRAPQGMSTSPSMLQFILNQILYPKEKLKNCDSYVVKPIFADIINCYYDDLILASESAEEMNLALQALFKRLQEVNFKLGITKSCFFAVNKTLSILGLDVNADGIKIPETKLKIAKNYARPHDVKSCMKFLGFMNYLSNFILRYQDLVYEFTEELGKGKGKITWTPSKEAAFQKVINEVCKGITLKHISYQHDFLFLSADSSYHSGGAILFQHYNGKIHINSYYSIKYPKIIREKYNSCLKEGIILCHAANKFKAQLSSVRQPVIITDNSAITFMLSASRAGNTRISRLALGLLSLPFKIVIWHRRGEDQLAADGLSRFLNTEHISIKLNNATAMDTTEIPDLNLSNGTVTSLDAINSKIQNNPKFVLPFLKNKKDIDKFEFDTTINQLNTLDEDLITTACLDKTMASDTMKTVIFPSLEKLKFTINGISMAANEITYEKILKFQRRDARCMQIINSILQQKPCAKHYALRNNILVRKRHKDKPIDDNGNFVIVIPHNSEIISYIISSAHYGHFGAKKTCKYLRLLFYIPNLNKYVQEFCSACAICSIMRHRKQPIDKRNHLFLATHPMHVLDVDIFYMEKVDKFTYVLNCIDRFSHKIMPFAIKTMSSKIITTCIEKIFSICGAASMICSDNQSSLAISRESVQFFAKYGCKVRTGTYYVSTAQSLIEQSHHSLKYCLKALCLQFDNKRWYELLPLAAYLINQQPNVGLANSYCPDHVFFGRAPMQNYPVTSVRISGHKHIIPDEYVKMTEQHHKDIKIAMTNYTKWKDTKFRPIDDGNPKFKVGSYVLFKQIHQPGIKQGVGIKFYNAIFRIEKKYHSWVQITNIYKTGPKPWTFTTSTRFLKEFKERSPFLFSHIKPDQQRIGGPLQIKDLPVNDQISQVPSIYKPEQRNNKKQFFPQKGDNSSVSSGTPAWSSESGSSALPNAAASGNNKNTENIKTQVPAEKLEPAKDSSRNLVQWIKDAVKNPARITRSGRKF